MRRVFFVLIVGFGGFAALVALGVWQLDRLAWKQELLAGIEARIVASPARLPAAPDAETDRYLPVTVAGRFEGVPLRVLISQKQVGAGWRLIQAFDTDGGRRILVDRGVISTGVKDLPGAGYAEVVGNLLWPDEVDGFTPAPDTQGNIWYARDLPAMAAALGTEEVLVVARMPTGPGIEPLPVGTDGIPNDHLEYAITWFSLAIVWVGMTGLWLWRIRRGKGEESA